MGMEQSSQKRSREPPSPSLNRSYSPINYSSNSSMLSYGNSYSEISSFSFKEGEDLGMKDSFLDDYCKPSKRPKLEVENRLNLLELPEEIIGHILEYLTIPQVRNFRLCCKHLRISIDKYIRLIIKIHPNFTISQFIRWLQTKVVLDVKFWGILAQDKTIENTAIDELLQICGSQFMSIELPYCWKLSDVALASISKHCGTNLRQLNIYNLNSITDEGLQTLAMQCTNLRILDLGHCYKITNAGLEYLGTHCSSLRDLNLSFCWNVTPKGIEDLLKKCPNLTIQKMGCRLF